LEELVEEAKAVIEAQRYDDPDQGKLFSDGKAEDDSSNGDAAHNRRGGPVRLSRSARKAVAEIAASGKIY
jgi:hypothetical protein